MDVQAANMMMRVVVRCNDELAGVQPRVNLLDEVDLMDSVRDSG
jgi:hypothetical protein